MGKVLVDKEKIEQLMTLCEEQQKRLDEFDKTEVFEITIPGLESTPSDEEIVAAVEPVEESIDDDYQASEPEDAEEEEEAATDLSDIIVRN